MALPLYTGGTYVMLGDSKYALFRSVSLLCLGLAAAALAIDCLLRRLKTTDGGDGGKRSLAPASPVDRCVLCYGLSVILSALFSSYGATAWTGCREWYMGAFSQLLFVGIYFFFSRQYSGEGLPIYLWEAAFFLVTLFGFCSRLGLDPLGLMEEFSPNMWEYSHLISTIGNINWFCGYCAVALSMPVAGYMKGKSFLKRLCLYGVSTAGLVLLCIQGSDVGPVLAVVCLGVCFLWGRENADYMGRTFLLAAGAMLGILCYSGLVSLLGEKAVQAIPADGPGLSLAGWPGWWILGAVCLMLYAVIRRWGNRKGVVRGVWLGTVSLAGVCLVLGGGIYLAGLLDSRGWAEGRGELWRLAWQGFLRGNWKQKLLGAGPDCFAEYIYASFGPEELFSVSGHWAGAVFANAHDHWLNHLINLGLAGLASAAAVAVAAVRRYRRYLPGMLALAMYGANSLVSFQQVLSTPLFFMMLGICEYNVRRSERKDQGLASEAEGRLA